MASDKHSISRRGFLGAVPGVTAAAAINPTLAIQQSLPKIAATAAPLGNTSYLFFSIRDSLLDALESDDYLTDDLWRELRKNEVNSFVGDLYDTARNLIFCSDAADVMSNEELTRFFQSASGDSRTPETLLECQTPNDIRTLLHDYRNKYINLYKASQRDFRDSHYNKPHLFHQNDLNQIPLSLRMTIQGLPLEDQIRLEIYCHHDICGEWKIAINKSLKGGIVGQIFDRLKETPILSERRRQVLEFVCCGDNDLLELTPDFTNSYIVDRPYTLRELKETYDAFWQSSYAQNAMMSFPYRNKDKYLDTPELECAKILRFYGVDPDKPLYPVDQDIITMHRIKRSFLSPNYTYEFGLISKGVKLTVSRDEIHDKIGDIHTLRHTVFEILGDHILNHDIEITDVDQFTPSIRVTVPANTDVAEFMEMWMAEQNEHDDFWDQEVPIEFLFDVDGYIKRHSSPAPAITRAGLFGRRPEVR